jgi:hypothetical protein
MDGAALHLLPEENPTRLILIRTWLVASIPLVIFTQLNAWFAALIVLALVLCAGMIAKLTLTSRFKNTFALLAVIALFVTLSAGLLILPLNWIPLTWGMTLLGIDLIFLAITLAVWDALDEGESIRVHLARSFVSNLYYAGALAIITTLFTDNLALLLLLITFAILTQTFSNSIQL